MTWQPGQYDEQAHRQRIGGGDGAYSPQQQPFYQQPQATWHDPGHPPQPVYGFGVTAPAQQPRKRRRVFMWVFLAVQVLFVIWLIAGLASAGGSNSTYAATQAAKFCGNGGWNPLYSSQAQCLSQYGATLKDAGNAGTAIGAGLIVAFWCVTDFLMGVTYLIVRLSRRRA